MTLPKDLIRLNILVYIKNLVHLSITISIQLLQIKVHLNKKILKYYSSYFLTN